jgi:hypothetical protein
MAQVYKDAGSGKKMHYLGVYPEETEAAVVAAEALGPVFMALLTTTVLIDALAAVTATRKGFPLPRGRLARTEHRLRRALDMWEKWHAKQGKNGNGSPPNRI